MLEDIQIHINTLDSIANDASVPKNIRRSAENMKKILSNDKEPQLQRTAKVAAELEYIGNDPNIPFHIRTKVWGLSSQLERISGNR